MLVVAAFILVGAIIALRHEEIERAYGRRKMLVLAHQHMLAAAATGSMSYMGTANAVWLCVGIVAAALNAVMWLACERAHVKRRQ